ncbi:5-hydroxytryptamine receptor 1A [Nematostella vectensis]|uniref:5-hydroxytryptamine receptor 1A n=1 Tax=Nematostella vectensis TaxID=45351 RepID=UPI002077219C|nr:5-hydroxytryptamine receptor 1A [Nematostella vectensis]
MEALDPTSAYFTNNSTELQPNELTSVTQLREPFGLKVFRGMIFAFVVIASLLGNSVVIKTVFENSLRKPMTYYLVSNMAVAELIGTVLVPFSYSYQEIFHWPFGELLCHIIAPLQVLSVLVTTTSLAAIALHRYKVFTSPRRVRVSGKTITCTIISLWAIAFFITLPSFLYLSHVKSPTQKGKYWCLELVPGDQLKDFPSPELRKYYMIRFFCNFVIPACVMMFSYGVVSLQLRFHRNRAVRDVEMETGSDRTRETSASTQPQQQGTVSMELHEVVRSPPHAQQPQHNASNSTREQATRERAQRKRQAISGLETDLLKMIYLIILIFLVCYFPYQIFFLLEYFGVMNYKNWQYFDITRIYVFLLTCFPSAIHPICYGTMSKFFARTFSRLVLCRWSYGDYP